MARGYPDYFGIPIWPMYGVIKKSELTKDTVLAAGDNTIHDISGKGIIRGGFFSILGGGVPSGCTIVLTIDGTELYNDDVEYIQSNDLMELSGGLLKLCYYDKRKYNYTIEFSRDIIYGYEYKFVVNMALLVGNKSYSKLFYADVI